MAIFVRVIHSNFLYGKKCMAIFCMVIFVWVHYIVIFCMVKNTSNFCVDYIIFFVCIEKH